MRLDFRAMAGKINITALLLLAGLGGSAQAQSFSADLVAIDARGEAAGKPGKVIVENGKVRIETPELPSDFFLVDPAAKSAYLVRPKQHIFMDAKQSSGLTQLLVQVDPADPCAQWQVMAKVAGAADTGGEWHCVRLGEEMLDGRATVKYEAISPRGETNIGWIDSNLKFLLRLRRGDGAGVDVRAVKEGPQGEDLFAIPANYAKFDPRQLIERIKQSDVWVEPPHDPPK
jgi:hypothetical protein